MRPSERHEYDFSDFMISLPNDSESPIKGESQLPSQGADDGHGAEYLYRSALLLLESGSPVGDEEQIYNYILQKEKQESAPKEEVYFPVQ